ncbi:MAG TPA: sodium-translocating pyrophosphatase [Thermoflexales bacterium]|nr:sodium-translocating pyrophosphatase [Thermoflexales bacterium]HQW34827.1 sodium-translocating pyrophosphatase [Thermoflexales bacterium]HQZ22642.1 sodium-translocating pyrophosphatase [Thermoflexales bacterium]
MGALQLKPFEVTSIYSVLVIAVISLLYAYFLFRNVMAESKGTDKMISVWTAIKNGADAYLGQQLRTILPFVGILVFALFGSVWIAQPTPEAHQMFGDNARIVIAFGRAIAFVLGASFSLIVGQLGMRMAVQGNIRVAAASNDTDSVRGYAKALQIAYRSGTVTGMLTDGLGLLGGTLIFIIFGASAPDALLGFGFGGTLLALFMRVGGGIYTKAADVGADLVGKVEENLEEDDPRNAAVIADLVGDNVGDCAGMAADIFESYEVTIVSALILGLALMRVTGNVYWIVFPLLVRAIGVISSIVGTFSVPIWERTVAKGNAWHAMELAYEVSSVITVVLSFLLSFVYIRLVDVNWWQPAAMITTGVVFNVIVNRLTAMFTSIDSTPVKEIAKSTRFGPATTILSGLAEGYESSVWSILTIAAAIAVSIVVYGNLGPQYIIYGVALIGIGWLTHAGNLVSMDAFGPISDNANGIGEMASMPERARKIMTELDAVGNTTKAITKGVAIGSAVIAAVSLFGSFITDIQVVQNEMIKNGQMAKEALITYINVADPRVFIGLLIGGGIPVLFGSMLVKAVSRAANGMVAVVRKEFDVPGVREGKVLPDYGKAVGISTLAAQRELLPVGILVILIPLVVGFALKAEALGGFLAGVILSGQLLAVFMSNTGGAWDNAKKLIEDGQYGGKGSDAHKASVVGDTVGDPMKDTAGPALNPLIKVINLISLIIAPIVVGIQGTPLVMVIALAALLALIIWAIRQSKKPAQYEV